MKFQQEFSSNAMNYENKKIGRITIGNVVGTIEKKGKNMRNFQVYSSLKEGVQVIKVRLGSSESLGKHHSMISTAMHRLDVSRQSDAIRERLVNTGANAQLAVTIHTPGVGVTPIGDCNEVRKTTN